jgi:uncharacterized membrane protein HdeD (DUF308 family)
MHSVNWWALLLRGIVAIIFGIVAFVLPGVTVLSLVFVFGAYAIIDGIFAIGVGIRSPASGGSWWMMLLMGVVGVVVGVLAFVWPGVTAFTLLMLIAAWAVVTGIFEIIAAIQLRRVIKGEWLMILSGAASVIFGILVLIDPAAGAVAIVWLIASWAIVYGIILLALALRVRSHDHRHHGATPHPV